MGSPASSFITKLVFSTQLLNKLESAILEGVIPPFVGGIEFLYPNGPLPAGDHHNGDTWAWGYGDFEHDQVTGLDKTIRSVMSLLDQQGPSLESLDFPLEQLLQQLLLPCWSDAIHVKCSQSRYVGVCKLVCSIKAIQNCFSLYPDSSSAASICDRVQRLYARTFFVPIFI